MPKLAVVTSAKPLAEAPYPSDILARGWTFDLNVEQLEQSDTWGLAPPELRPWLLMLWMMSWKSAPCGSLPNIDTVICSRIGMPPSMFALHRDVLMRGWELHADGRLYHSTITEMVLRMAGKRTSDRVRMARSRDTKNQGDTPNVTRDSQRLAESHAHPQSPYPLPSTTLKDEQASPACPAPDGPSVCPQLEIVQAFNRLLPQAVKVDVDRWGEHRRRLLRARWKEVWLFLGKKGKPRDREAMVAWFERLFTFCSQSKFLMGKVPGRDNQPPFDLKLEWLLGPKNFTRVCEGDFHREGK